MRALILLLIFLAAPALAAPVKHRFGAVTSAAAGPPAAHGSYAKGCLAGGAALPVDGPGWRVMRLSRNRMWGHPEMLDFVARLAGAAQGVGWAGIFVGDISQPRGGPMTSGHRSHQIGMDADIWMRPGEMRPLTPAAREEMSSFSVVARDRLSVNGRWTEAHARLLRAAAEDAAVARIFVNAAVKKRLCETAGADRDWLRKVRPWWGHDHHFHVRLACPAGSPGCDGQDSPPAGDGCDATLDWWFTDEALNPPPGPPRAELTLADLPPACAAVLEAE